MKVLKLRNRVWPVLAVAAIAAASFAVVAAVDAHDLDPQVWQAVIAFADPTPDLDSPQTGETP